MGGGEGDAGVGETGGMNSATPQARPNAWFPEPADWIRGIIICVIAGLFLAFAGAFGSAQAPLSRRLIYWVPLMVTGGLMGSLIARPIFNLRWTTTRPWLGVLAVTALLTPPLTLVVWGASNLAWNQSWNPRWIPNAILPVAVVSLVMTAINYMADRRPRETHAAPAGSAPPKFLERIPMKLRGAELYAVEAEDHYLRIHTERGSDLILLRLSDAIGELEGIEGAQTHRSWWVAKDAVAQVERGDGRATFVLKDGARAPVSRTFARTLRAEGWY